MECKECFTDNTTQQADSIFTVWLPIKLDTKQLRKSKQTAQYRLLQTDRRFLKNPQIKEKNQIFMKEYQHLGYKQLVQDPAVRQRWSLFLSSTSSSLQGFKYNYLCNSCLWRKCQDLNWTHYITRSLLAPSLLPYISNMFQCQHSYKVLAHHITVHPQDQPLQIMIW
jgi:hypothetical protein